MTVALYQGAFLLYLLCEKRRIVIPEIGKFSLVEGFSDSFGKGIVEIKIMLHRKSACKLFAGLEKVADIAP